MPRCVIYCLLSFVVTLSAQAQEDDHVTWRVRHQVMEPGLYKLVMTAEIDPGYHMYSQHIGEGGPIPTKFSFQKSSSIKLIGKTKELGREVRSYDSTFLMPVIWYEDRVEFSQLMKVRTGSRVEVKVSFAVCTEELCVPGEVVLREELRE